MTGLTSKVMAQTSTTPYVGGTYSYTVGDIDNVTNARTARVFINTDGTGSTPALAHASKYVVQNATDGDGNTLTITDTEANYFDVALLAGDTELNFDIEYNAAFTTGAYDLYVQLFDGTAPTTDCFNYVFLDITVTANNFNLVIAAVDASKCQALGTGVTSGNPAADSGSTTFAYTVTRSGGVDTYDWAFDFDLNATTLVYDGSTTTINNITATTPGTGSVNITETSVGDYTMVVTNNEASDNVVTITFTIATTAGASDKDFEAALANAVLRLKHTTDVITTTETDVTDADNKATVTLKRMPHIGSFTAN